MSTCRPLSNLGASHCDNPMQIARRLTLVPELDNSGTKNEFANAAAVTLSALQAKFDAPNINDRFFPLPELENVENLRPDTTFQEFNSGKKAKVKDGVRHFIGYMPLEHPQLLDRLQEWYGQKFGFYATDSDSNFIHQTDRATKLKVQPFLVEGGSFDAQLVEATDAEVNMIKIEFDYRIGTDDGLKRYIAAEDLDFDGLSESDVYSLWDVSSTISNESTTGFTALLKDDFDVVVKGLLVGDFALYNVTDAASVVITTVTENPAGSGSYDFVIPSQDAGDVLRLTPTKARYDFADVVTNTITIPVATTTAATTTA